MPDAREAPEPQYVNDLPAGSPPDTPRCQHVFTERGGACGLPAETHDADPAPCCYFHSRRPRENDSDLPARLVHAVAEGRILWEARLRDAPLAGAHLAGAELQFAVLSLADLPGANLWGAQLQGARLDGANLQGAVLLEADLQGADLSAAKLQGARLEGANLREADLGFAAFGILLLSEGRQGTAVIQSANLRGAHLEGALLSKATFAAEADLSGACFGDQEPRPWWRFGQPGWSQYHIADERCARSDVEWEKTKKLNSYLGQFYRPTLANCETIYRQLKLCDQQSGDYQTAGEFYLREMECKRAALAKDEKRPGWWGRFLLAVMYFSCGYGERPWWVIGWGAVVTVAFAFLQGWLGVTDTQGHVTVSGFHAPSLAGIVHWSTALYCSAVTCVTLGFGDVVPASAWSRAVASVEGLLGFLLLSLFLVCIVRKFSR